MWPYWLEVICFSYPISLLASPNNPTPYPSLFLGGGGGDRIVSAPPIPRPFHSGVASPLEEVTALLKLSPVTDSLNGVGHLAGKFCTTYVAT